MNIVNPKTALISLSDKSKLDHIINFLIKKNIKILSTGGTYNAIKELTNSVIEVSEFTGFNEIMDGRVKTLHPKIHAGILARRDSDLELLKEKEELLAESKEEEQKKANLHQDAEKRLINTELVFV